MSQNGKEREALAITDSILKGMPFSAWQSDVMEIEDSVADEETILYELRLGIGRNLGDGKIVSDAEKGVADANARKERWRRFVESLSQSDRARLSARTRQKQ